MEDIQVGEYVRTKQGEIAKIVNTNMFDKSIYKDIQGAKYYLEDITKHSSNIIDLIEVGDIVHIKDVLHEDIVYIWSQEYLEALKEDINNGIKLVEILTKEQYNQNCYKIDTN